MILYYTPEMSELQGVEGEFWENWSILRFQIPSPIHILTKSYVLPCGFDCLFDTHTNATRLLTANAVF